MKEYKKWSMVLAAQAFFGVGELSAQEIYGGQLDSIVVQVAYGSAKKSAVTGAVSQADSKVIEKHGVSDGLVALEGSLPGVYIASSTGMPGDLAPKIFVRGYGTVNGSNMSQPLYIVDGVTLGDNTIDINPDDIESISVLKDAASAALYGNRAANGVVLITTKRGKGNKMKFDLKMTQGSYARAIKDYKTLNPVDYLQASWLAMRNSYMSSKKDAVLADANAYASQSVMTDLKLNIFNKPADALFDADGRVTEGTQVLPGYADDLDWIDQGTRTGYRQSYSFSGSQASSTSDVYFSVSDLNEKGYLPNSGYDRLTGRLNLNMRPTDWFKAGISMSGTYQNRDMADDGTQSYVNVFRVGRFMAPIYPVHLHNADGSYVLDGDGNKVYDTGSYVDAEGNTIQTRPDMDKNMIWENELNKKKIRRSTMQSIAYADFKFLSDFTFTIKGDINLRNQKFTDYYNSVLGSTKSVNGRLDMKDYQFRNYSFQQQLRWNHTYGDHTLDVLLGHENYQYKVEYSREIKSNESVFGSTSMSHYATLETLTGSANTHRMESYLGRLRYNYKNRYNVEGSIRRDGSSRFAPGHRWGTFGSVGGNWVVSEEAFMRPVEWVNSLVLRADWGVVGNDAAVGFNQYDATYSSTLANGGKPAYIITQLGNDKLKWEKAESFGFGLETRLFNRWNVSVEYFDKKNKDLLFKVYNPISAGGTGGYQDFTSSVWKNLGTISNRGFEVSTDVDIYRDKDWKVNLGANATFISNKITKLPDQNKDGILNDIYKFAEGKSMYSYYLYSYVGVDQMTGKALYKADLETNKVLDAEDAVIAGNPDGADISKEVVCINGNYYVNKVANAMKEFHGQAMPKVYGSFTPSVSYKSFTFSAMFTYSLGGKVYDAVYKQLMSSGVSPSNYHADIAKSWNGVPEGMTEDSSNRIWVNGIPEVNSYTSGDNNAESSRWLISGNYISLKNIYASYDLPKKWVSKLSLEGVKVNIACENLFVSAKRRGLDPQQNFTGYHTVLTPTPRVFTVGLNVKL